MQGKTIYERLGGYKQIEQIVAEFYQNILIDDEINIFYLQNVSDIAVLHHSVADFFTMLFGGPNNYKGRSMIQSHKHMPIRQLDFDLVWSYMEKSFRKHGTSEDLLKEIKGIIYSLVPEIVNK